VALYIFRGWRGARLKRLVLPSVAYRTAFLKMAYEYRHRDDRRYYKDVSKRGFTLEAYVRRLEAHARGERLPEGLVPYTTFWLIDSGATIYGVSRLRHVLNEVSQKEGGHIGYDVPPSQRNQGNGTILLRETLKKAREMGFARVLVTCDTQNRASARVIEKNGGVLENQVLSDFTRRLVSRYWFDL